jgi:hypothetical protein
VLGISSLETVNCKQASVPDCVACTKIQVNGVKLNQVNLILDAIRSIWEQVTAFLKN